MAAITSYEIGSPFLKWVIGLLVARVDPDANEFIRFSVRADSDGRPVNPMADVVEMAFLTSSARPVGADWIAGEWDVTVIGTYVAQIRSGDAGVIAGRRYNVWVRITAASTGEVVQRCTGVVLT